MGHPRSPARFGVAVQSTGGSYDWRYPQGLPTVTALGAAIAAANATAAAGTAAVTGGASWWLPGQLGAGHWRPKVLDGYVAFPRPDSETGILGSTATAAHRVCYYDGVNPFKYFVHPHVLGMAEPIMWNLDIAPPWASIPYPFYRGVDVNGDAIPYGWVEGTPTQAYSAGSPAAFQVTGRDQNGETVVINWTMYTDNSFYLFVDNVNGSDANAGDIAHPFQTLGKVMGAATSSTTYPNKIICIRGRGTPYAMAIQTGGAGTAYLDGARTPISYMSYPDEDVTISLANSQLRISHIADGGIYGTPAHPISLSGSSSTSAEAHGIWIDENDRFTFRNIRFPNPVSRTAGLETNTTSIHAGSQTVHRKHISLTDCEETGRTTVGGANNNYMLHNMFCTDYSGAQFCRGKCTVTDDFTNGLTWKDSNTYCVSRFCTSALYSASGTGGGGQGMLAMSQTTGGQVSFVGCLVVGGYLGFNLQAGGIGPFYSTRNTIYASDLQENQAIRGVASGSATFFSDADAIVARSQAVTANVSATNTEVQYLWNGDGAPGGVNTPFDKVTGKLRNISGGTQWAALYDRTALSRGHVYG